MVLLVLSVAWSGFAQLPQPQEQPGSNNGPMVGGFQFLREVLVWIVESMLQWYAAVAGGVAMVFWYLADFALGILFDALQGVLPFFEPILPEEVGAGVDLFYAYLPVMNYWLPVQEAAVMALSLVYFGGAVWVIRLILKAIPTIW